MWKTSAKCRGNALAKRSDSLLKTKTVSGPVKDGPGRLVRAPQGVLASSLWTPELVCTPSTSVTSQRGCYS